MTTYESTARLSRGRKLNTIMEDHEATSFGARSSSESETDGSESTIVGKPVQGTRLYTTAPKKGSNLRASTAPDSPISDMTTPASSAGSGIQRRSTRSSFAESDDGTVFSESCPSLGDAGMSDTTTIFTDSARSSMVGGNKPKYPSLLIPHRESWGSITSLKEITLGISPIAKIPLSPEALSTIPNWAPMINTTPSLGATSSVTSESPSIPVISAPATPDIRQISHEDEDNWHESHGNHGIALGIEEHHSPLQLPRLRQSIGQSEANWSDIVQHFPIIPGATPTSNTPVTPAVKRMVDYLESPISERGIFLPEAALRTLSGLARDHSPSAASRLALSAQEEMEEGLQPPSRPRSDIGLTPISEYSEHSFTQLSIPSPGGFFASLGAGTRHTWSIGPSKYAPPPSSATAENFYNAPWNQPNTLVQTLLEVEPTETEGPPTARQAEFNSQIRDDTLSESRNSSETSDMYGAPSESEASTIPAERVNLPQEYEDAYDEELKQAAEAHLDRTSTWLAAQTTYLSALRETNPVNDLSDPSSIHLAQLHDQLKAENTSSQLAVSRNRSVRFDPAVLAAQKLTGRGPLPKDPVLLEALRYHLQYWRSRDAFLAASTRLSLVKSLRTIAPADHLSKYLHGGVRLPKPTSTTRPKYSGPFAHNPRQTCLLDQPPPIESATFNAVELQQSALGIVQPHTWTVDALKYLYSGRLLASQAACDRLTSKAITPLTSPECVGKKRLRVLDLGDVPNTASWAWQTALKWPNVKVYSVLTKEQAKAARPFLNTQSTPNMSSMPTNSATSTPATSPIEPDTAKIGCPPNHRTTTVPHLYCLPFRANTFDVVRAHSLHALLKSEPVPGVPTIDEFDLTLKEIMRVLKPGGIIDFMVMDSGIKGAGPLGDKTSVEFGFLLKSMGYERDVTRNWLGRLNRAGYTNIKRAWWAAPLGSAVSSSNDHGDAQGRDGGRTWKDAPRPLSEVSVRKILDEYIDVEAVRGPVGCTAGVADITGLLGGYMWESWLVRIREESARRKASMSVAAAASRNSQMSTKSGATATTTATVAAVSDETKVLDGLAEVLEEGCRTGACWRMLSGWAKKPMKTRKRTSDRSTVPVIAEHSEKPLPNIPTPMVEQREMTERPMAPLIRHSYNTSMSSTANRPLSLIQLQQTPPHALKHVSLPPESPLSRNDTISTRRSSGMQSVELSLDLSSEGTLSDGGPTPRQLDFTMLSNMQDPSAFYRGEQQQRPRVVHIQHTSRSQRRRERAPSNTTQQQDLLRLRGSHIRHMLGTGQDSLYLDDNDSVVTDVENCGEEMEEGVGTMSSTATWIGTGIRREDSTTGTIRMELSL